MSEIQNSEATPIEGVAQQSAPVSFVVPPGYKLIPIEIYESLLEQKSAKPKKKDEESDSPVYRVETVKQIMLGDIKVNLTPGLVFQYKENEYLVIHGKKYHQLGSFISAWNAQFNYNRKSSGNRPYYFEILNEAEVS